MKKRKTVKVNLKKNFHIMTKLKRRKRKISSRRIQSRAANTTNEDVKNGVLSVKSVLLADFAMTK